MIESYVRGDGCVVCVPHGQLDWISSMSLRHLFHDILTPEATIEVDLSRVTFVDAVGLSALLGGYRRARALGISLRLRDPRPQVRRQLRLVGFDRLVAMSGFAESDGHDAA